MRHLKCIIALFTLSCLYLLPPCAQAYLVLGLGNGALIGDDLTDRGDDGIEAAYNPPGAYGNFDADFSSSSASAFNNGESAFNVFDNFTGPSTNKWCCSPTANTVTAQILVGAHRLTAFTLTSSNDSPLRDPRVWEIQGSNDGATFTTIFRQDDAAASVWGNDRNEVIHFSAANGDAFAVTNQAFAYFRLETFSTGGPEFALGEIELFGDANLNPELANLDGDVLDYLAGSGVQTIDQSSPASASDPLIGPSGFDGGTLTATITLGGVPAEDNLSLPGGTSIGAISGGTNGLPLVITFNDTATLPGISTLLNTIAYENSNPTPTPTTRVVEFQLTDGDGGSSKISKVSINIDLGGPATEYVWDGGGDGSTYSDPQNWVGDTDFPDGNDVAIFRSDIGSGTGTIDLLGQRFVGEVRFDGGGSFELTGGPLVTSLIHQQSTATGDNTIGALISSTTFVGIIDGGTLAVTNTGNPDTLLIGTWTVNTGGELIRSGGDSLGLADVQLVGGTLSLLPQPSSVTGRFIQIVNNGVALRQLHMGELEVFDARTTPTINNSGGEGALNPTTDLATNNRGASIFAKGAASAFVNDHSGDDDGRLLDGAENNAGNTFGITGVEAFVTVDLGATREIGRVRFHQRNDACCQDRLRDVTVNVFEDNGGVPGPLVDSLSFPTQPANQNFGEVIFTPEPLGTPGENSVTLLSSSTINLNPGAPGTLEDLHVSVIAELHVIAPSGGDLNFLGATTLDATASFTQSGSPVVTLNTVSGAGGITQNGDGTLFLPTENTYAGTTVINSGQIFADNGDALGDPAQGTTVQPTAALLFARGTFAEPLTLGSVGNTTVRGGLRKLPGANVVWTGPIDATTNALIYSSGDLLTLEGGITLTPNATLDVDAQNQILVQNEGIKGDPTTLLRFEGNDRTRLAVTSSNFLGNVEVFNNGRLQLEADGALGDNAGTTRITSGEASLVLRDSITQIETLEIFGDGRGTEGAIRNLIGDNTIQGTITLSAATELVIQAGSTLTLDGPLLGGVDLIQRQTGTLVLTHDNELTDFNLIGGGTTRIQSEGALGDTPVAVVDAGETLEFDGDLQFNGTTNLLQITANGGTISSFSGTTTVDIPVNAGANISYRFGGAGNLLITQPFGNGPGATTNELIKTDSGEVNLSAANTYNGDTTIINGTLIASHNDALGAPTANLVLFSSGTLELQGGIDVMRDEILFDGTGASNRLGALASSGGINTLTATAFMAQPFSIGDVRIAAVDGSFTLNGSVEMEHARLSTAGAGDIQFTGSISGPGGLFSPEARFVQVQKNIPGRLHIGELEVYAPGTAAVNDDVPGANTPLNNPDDLALTSQGATTYSASAGDGHGVPASVIDGLEQTAAATWTSDQGLTAPTAEITIDLGITSAIDTIRLHQRNDSCCQDRLENFTVNLFADDGGVPGILISSQVFPGRPPVNSFGEMTFTSTVTNSYNKTGTGTVTFSSPNFYGGGSAVQEGILIANGNPAVGSASVVADNGGTLSGTGTISSNVVIGTRGSISPGASTGVLPIGGELVFTNASSVYIAEIENPFTGDFDRLTVTGDIDLNDATLDLRRIPGYSSTLSDTVVLATYGGSLTGTFNGLPEGSLVSAEGEAFTISYLGGMIQLIATGTSHVYAGPDTISRQGTNGVTISTAELLLNDQIGIGPGPLSVTAVSAMGVSGGTITLNSNTVTYTPPPGYTGNDSFSYTITDGTDTTMGLVTVRVTEVPIAAPAVGNPSGLEKLPGGEYRIAFTGTAGATYTVQRALDLTATPSVTWTDVETVVADQDGNIIVEDPAPPEGIVYYRAIAD